MVVTLSANELSIGITKLSGSHPLLYVAIATMYAMTTMTETAKPFVTKSLAVIAKRLFKATVPQANNDVIEYNANINTEAVQAPPISVLCCLIEEKDG